MHTTNHFSHNSIIIKSVQVYSLQNLTVAKHTIELQDAPFVTFNVDFQQQGLGGDNSWQPRTHVEYLLGERRYRYGYRVRGIEAKDL
ncbi:MAG: hypothetical protein R3E32_16640 [Chitinophagales bacterium]